MNSKNKIAAFTLIELMVVITISVLLMVWIYAPYNYYSNKARLKMAKTQIAKTIYEARNMAIYWLNNQSKNKSIWVYFDNNLNKNYINIYSYPYDFLWNKNDFLDINVKLIKSIKLEKWIQIDKVNNKDKALFYFNAISWTGTYYYYNPWEHIFTNNQIKIKFSYKNWWPNLSSFITYYTLTNIVDY